MAPAAKPKPPTYGKPEKPNRWKTVAFWGFVVAGLAFIGWLVYIAKPMKALTCERNDVNLIEFGTCHE